MMKFTQNDILAEGGRLGGHNEVIDTRLIVQDGLYLIMIFYRFCLASKSYFFTEVNCFVLKLPHGKK